MIRCAPIQPPPEHRGTDTSRSSILARTGSARPRDPSPNPPSIPRWAGLGLLLAIACSPSDGGGSESTSATTEASATASSSTPQPEDPTGTSSTRGASTTATTTSDSETTSGNDSTGDASTTASANGNCDPGDPSLTDEGRGLIELEADTWWKAPRTSLRPHCASGLETNCAGVIGGWSGGTFDPIRSRLLIFGGGHVNYSGNEVYAFSLPELSWERLTEPSPPSMGNEDPLPDGQPVSRHTYDGIVYLAEDDAMLTRGGSRWSDGSLTPVTWRFDGETHDWTRPRATNAPQLGHCCSNASAYDSVAGNAYFHVIHRLTRYDPQADAWSDVLNLQSPPYWPRYQIWGDKTGVFDPSRSLVWFFGSGLYMVYDVANNTVVTDDWITTGGSSFTNAEGLENYPDQVISTGGREIIRGKGPGLAYDGAADALVAWVGGGPWVLDLAQRHWTQTSAEGAPPEGPSSQGTYGRWRYAERYNVFVLVNSVDDDVYFYKHRAGCG